MSSGGLITALLVLARVAATNWANVIQKQLLLRSELSPLGLFAAVWSWMALLTLPWTIGLWATGTAKEFWVWMAITCALEVPGNVLLLRSLRNTELSIFGPLSSFKPVISLGLAFVCFGERPTAFGLLGVCIVLLGTAWLTSEPREPMSLADQKLRYKGIRDRLLAVLLTAMASVCLKQTLTTQTSWQALAAWCWISWMIAVVWWMLVRGKKRRKAFSRSESASATIGLTELWKLNDWRWHYRIGATSAGMLVMQGCTIALFARMPVGYALALFQMGSLISVLLGHRLFGEGNLVRRLAASCLMIAGAVLIIVAG